MKKRIFSIFLVLATFWLPLFATVGGPQPLELLGFSTGEYWLLRHHEDESGRAPDLISVDITSGEVTVSYPWGFDTPTEEQIEEAMGGRVQMPELLNSAAKGDWGVKKHDVVRKYVEFYESDADFRPLTVQFFSREFSLENCFQPDFPAGFEQVWISPDGFLAFGIFRYVGICYEGGYYRDTLLIAPVNPRENSPSETTSSEADSLISDSLVTDSVSLDAARTEEIIPPPAAEIRANRVKFWSWTIGLIIAVIAIIWIAIQNRRQKEK